MKLIATSSITAHGEDGPPKEYAKGDEIDVKNETQAQWLIESGAAIKPADARKAAKAEEATGA